MTQNKNSDASLSGVDSQKNIKIKDFLIKVVLLVSVFSIPVSQTHASFFSFLSSETVSASTVSNSNEKIAMLSPLSALSLDIPVNPSLNTALVLDAVLIAGDGLVAPVNPVETLAEENKPKTAHQISMYITREDETIAEIAKMYEVSCNTIRWANSMEKYACDEKLKEGIELVIFPTTGVKYAIKKGDTLGGIAKKCNSTIDEIKYFNEITNDFIRVGMEIIIPDIEAPCVEPVKASKPTSSNPTYAVQDYSGPVIKGYFMRPMASGCLTQGVHGHNGIDFSGAPIGTSIVASAAGTITVAINNGGYNGGYGNYVVISHANGTQTLYGHMNSVSVKVGQQVVQGQKIGGMGNSGKSTGPHLHFEIRGATNVFATEKHCAGF
jgi:LysM repeat protein